MIPSSDYECKDGMVLASGGHNAGHTACFPIVTVEHMLDVAIQPRFQPFLATFYCTCAKMAMVLLLV